MNHERVIFNTCSMYQHSESQTQVYVITGPKGSKIAETLKTVRPGMPPDYGTCLLLPGGKGFHLDSWPIDPKANMYEVFAGVARFLRGLPEDRVICAIVFGENVNFFRE